MQANISAFRVTQKIEKDVCVCICVSEKRDGSAPLVVGVNILQPSQDPMLRISLQRLYSISNMHFIMSFNVFAIKSSLYKGSKHLTLVISCRKAKQIDTLYKGCPMKKMQISYDTATFAFSRGFSDDTHCMSLPDLPLGMVHILVVRPCRVNLTSVTVILHVASQNH